jgi:predicted CoA-substrate-specific enzyme activase
MNDKCAAGTGRFLEVTAGRLGLGLGEIGPAALTASRELPISSTCTVFAESEIVSLVAAGEPIEAILRGLHRSLARRVAALVRSLGPRLDRGSLMVSGGGALNPALVAFLGEELGVGAAVAPEPLLVGAWGAALAGLARG